ILLVVDVLVATLIAASFGSQSPIILYSMSTAVLIGILLAERYAWIVLSVLILAYLLVAIELEEHATSVSILMMPISYLIIGALGILSHRLHKNAQAEHHRTRLMSTRVAQERERARLARELHDSVAKDLHGIGLSAAALTQLADRQPETVAGMARELHSSAEGAANRARSILVDLRSESDDRTLAEQLRSVADDLDSGSISTSLTLEGVGDCD